MGAPSVLKIALDPHKPEEWLTPMAGDKPGFSIKNDNAHEYWAYLDIHDEPFSVYPIIEPVD
jgi:hypothetical protein